jgi:hypothetical protein
MLIRNYPFEHVTIATDHGCRMRNIGSVEEAAEFMLHNWPDKQGRKFNTARRACLDAMRGKQTAQSARMAFINAAEEVGIYVRERTPRHHAE